MQLHQRAIDLLTNVQDAADHVESLTRDEMRDLLREIGLVLGELLERDVPLVGPGSGQPETLGWDRLKGN